MTPDEMGKMTLEDIEAMSKRLGAAVATLREAQKFLGPTSITVQNAEFPSETEPGQMRRVGPPPPQLLPNEVAEREKLMRQFKHDGLPDAIKALEEQQ